MSEKGISRRGFLGGAAVAAAAAALPAVNATSAAAAPAITFPLSIKNADNSFTPLDATKAARRAYEIYRGVHAGQSACCEATYWPIVEQLAERFPTTWGLVPKGLYNYGGGGVSGWGGMCGCTNGGPALMTQMGMPQGVIDTYLTWYGSTLLPTNASYIDYRGGTWTDINGNAPAWTTAVGAGKFTIPFNNAPKSKARSVLCHASVTNWRVAGGNWEKTHVYAQKDRCAKLCYDVVYKIVTLVNAYMANPTGFTALPLDSSVTGCKTADCHVESLDGAGNIATATPPVNGKMTCTPCHDQRLGDNHGL